MNSRSAPTIAAAILALGIQGCALAPSGPTPAELAASTSLPIEEPALDHYIAWVPRDAAQTPTVARALAHTALGKARKQAVDRLCGGTWVRNNTVTDVVGPLAAWAPGPAGGYAAWYYRVSHLPGLRGCADTADARVYRVMEDSLPAWLRVRPAAAGAVTLLE